MFGRLTRVVALAAVVAHLWVSMVVAPWHHLVAHRLPAAGADEQAVSMRPVVASQCQCRHHAHRTVIPTCDRPAGDSHEHPSPTVPDHHDDCPVCQVLAQQIHAIAVAAPIVALERIEFSPPVSAIQPMLGSLIDPVSRGPPIV